MVYPRLLDLRQEAARRSVFLFGPRQTGKTTLLRAQFPDSLFLNLLRGDVFLRFSSRPGQLRQEVAALRGAADPPAPVIVDEIQKLPSLLDDVHDLIESEGRTFVLCGSSATRLRRGSFNLLGGRARVRYLFPFVSHELPDWDFMRALSVGGIPSIYLSEDPVEDLKAYCGSYVQLEVQSEGLVRGIEAFSRFFRVAGATAGRQVNFERVSNDAAVPARTVREFYQILQDTLFGEIIPVFQPRSGSRKPAAHGKFYFFDAGVANLLAGRLHVEPGTDAFGRALEQLVYCEIHGYLGYKNDDRPLSFWRTRDGSEVDFVVGDDVAIEVKGGRVGGQDLIGLRRLADETRLRRRIVVCAEDAPRIADGIEILPAVQFFSRLWSDEIL